MHKKIMSWIGLFLCFTGSGFAQLDEGFENATECCNETECCAEATPSINGKIDLGPAYVHVDILLKGHTDRKMDMGGVRGDFNYRIWKGLVIKPTFLYARGNHKDEVCTGGVGLGFCLPYKQCFCFTPVVGINWGHLKTTIMVPAYFVNPHADPTAVTIESQTFRSSSPYTGFEFSYSFLTNWRIVLNYQYSWSRTRTKIRKVLVSKEHSKGSNYSFLLEYDLNDHWSINLGGAYNCSLSKEKHGLRAYGYKLGLAYWF